MVNYCGHADCWWSADSAQAWCIGPCDQSWWEEWRAGVTPGHRTGGGARLE